ncbi:MAG: radical domain protein [Nitrosarchaeum sp.]|nr:radical domain protein [Nitrosarchaeum sp.]
MYKVNSCEFNYIYNGRVFLPYSIASLVSHVKTNSQIEQNFHFEKTFISRAKVDEYVKLCHDTDILLCSCYVWNWEITVYLAEQIKKFNPECLIIFGGPQVPDLADGFFKKYPFVDIIVHGEGEKTLEEILEFYMNKQDFSKIDGLETKDFKTSLRTRMNDLNVVPSPYLSNLIWDLTEKSEGQKFMAIWETNRGCPYQCTFCDWGSLTYTKLRNYSDERLMKEIEWFADNKIEFIHCADANFGIFQKRDFLIAKKMKEEKLKKGYPIGFRLTWAKFSSEKIIPIAQELQKADLLTPVTLSVQSLDETTLEIIKRENIKFDKFSELAEVFRQNNIPTYTEIIRGLPGETIESFKKGLETIAKTQISTTYIYNCVVMPNAPMNYPEYRKQYQIQVGRSPIYLAHSSIHDREMNEYEDFALSTSSYSKNDFKEMHIWSWFMQAFQTFGILDHVQKFYEKMHDVSFIQFYEVFHEFCKSGNSIFSREFEIMEKHTENGIAGKGWSYFDENLGEIFWAIEEGTWLHLVENGNDLKNEILHFLNFFEKKNQLKTDSELQTDLVNFQIFLLTTRDDTREIKQMTFKNYWHEFFQSDSPLKNQEISYFFKNPVQENDYVKWGFEAIWWGRSQRKFKSDPRSIKILENKPITT